MALVELGGWWKLIRCLHEFGFTLDLKGVGCVELKNCDEFV